MGTFLMFIKSSADGQVSFLCLNNLSKRDFRRIRFGRIPGNGQRSRRANFLFAELRAEHSVTPNNSIHQKLFLNLLNSQPDTGQTGTDSYAKLQTGTEATSDHSHLVDPRFLGRAD